MNCIYYHFLIDSVKQKSHLSIFNVIYLPLMILLNLKLKVFNIKISSLKMTPFTTVALRFIYTFTQRRSHLNTIFTFFYLLKGVGEKKITSSR